MHTAAHTPRPWAVDGNLIVWAPESGYSIAELLSPPNRTEREANGRLIAAAPDMLIALSKLLSWIQGSDGDEQISIKTLNEARVAVAKATGVA